MSNVKQIGTAKNFLYNLDMRFGAINKNQIANRILILILILWCGILTTVIIIDKLNVKNCNNNEISVPITSLEMIE